MDIIYILLRASVAVGAIILLTRINGLRSFSKMSGFDFAITVAIGSVLASTVMASTPRDFWSNLGVLVAFFAVQRLVAELRIRNDAVENWIDNDPLLLMRNGEFFEENLLKAQVTRSDVIEKLRESNALRLSQVRAVVLEATGDISVLHGDVDIDEELLDSVMR